MSLSFFNLCSLIKDRTDQFVFYNRGQIEMKGLGLRQTFFVEKAGNNCDIIYVQPDTEKEGTPEHATTTSNSLQPFLDNTLRNSSFIKLSRCTIVPSPPQSAQPSWPDDVDTSKGSSNTPGKSMSRPPPSSSNVLPIPEENESPNTHTPGQNGVTSIFISSPSSTNITPAAITTEEKKTEPPPAGRRSKCVIS